MKVSERLLLKLEKMNLVESDEWVESRIRRCRSGKHQLADGFWSWEVDFPFGTCMVIGSTSTMTECVKAKELTVNRISGFITVEPMD